MTTPLGGSWPRCGCRRPGVRPEPRVHPGREWFYVLTGTVRLLLGEREHLVTAGQAAEFDTMTPHRMLGHGAPAEILTIFDRHGEDAHLRPGPPAPPAP